MVATSRLCLDHNRKRHREFLPERDAEQIFQLYGVSSWQELEETGHENEMLSIHLKMHLIDWNTIVKLSLKEQAGRAENVREFIRQAAKKRGLTESTVRNILYRN